MKQILKAFLTIVAGLVISLYIIAFSMALRTGLQADRRMAWNVCNLNVESWEYIIPARRLGCLMNSTY